MKKFIIIMLMICIMCSCICYYYRKQYLQTDYHVENAFDQFQVGAGVHYTFFMKPSELGLGEDDGEIKVEYLDKDGNVIDSEIIVTEKEEKEDISEAEQLKQSFTEADHIVIAVPKKEFTLFNCTIQQPLYVKKVIKGDSSLETTTIVLQGRSARLSLSQHVFGGCTNYMKIGEEYLVFLDDIENGFSEKINMYYEIEPISYFRLNDVEEVILNGTGKYDSIANNEFFITDEVALEKILKLKKEILEQYLK